MSNKRFRQRGPDGHAYDIRSSGPEGAPRKAGFHDMMGDNPTMSVARPGAARAFMVQSGGIRGRSSVTPIDAQGPCPTSLPVGRVFLHPSEAGYLSPKEEKEYQRKLSAGQDSDSAYSEMTRPVARRQTRTAKSSALGTGEIRLMSPPRDVVQAIAAHEAAQQNLAAAEAALESCQDKTQKKALREKRNAAQEEEKSARKTKDKAVGDLAASQGLMESATGRGIEAIVSPDGSLTLRSTPIERAPSSTAVSYRQNEDGSWTTVQSVAWDKDNDLLRELCWVYRNGTSFTPDRITLASERRRIPGVRRLVDCKGPNTWRVSALRDISILGWHRAANGMILRVRFDGAGIFDIPREALKRGVEWRRECLTQAFLEAVK